jgi:hypothetical protein
LLLQIEYFRLSLLSISKPKKIQATKEIIMLIPGEILTGANAG